MKYIALLRGVNVGGKNKVQMSDLKKCFEDAGFQNVVTYINSGNVIFDSEEENVLKVRQECGEMLREKFGFVIGVALLNIAALREALDHVPEWWGDDRDSKHNAIVVIPPATAEKVIEEAGAIKPEYEKLYAYGDIIFWSAPFETFSRTRWSKVVGTKAYQSVTIRNANTFRKLLQIANV